MKGCSNISLNGQLVGWDQLDAIKKREIELEVKTIIAKTMGCQVQKVILKNQRSGDRI